MIEDNSPSNWMDYYGWIGHSYIPPLISSLGKSLKENRRLVQI